MAFRPRLTLMLVLGSILFAPFASAPPVFAATPQGVSPGLTAQAMRSDLFAAQSALLAGDAEAATKAVADAAASASSLLPLFVADAEAPRLLKGEVIAAEAAVAANDPIALALAHGQIWSTLARGAYAETLAAIAAGDAGRGADWLLVRDFRITTRYDRPNADATLALQQLRAGEITPEQAGEVVRADLLDTYQARVEATLDDISRAIPGSLTSSEAEAVGLATGFWPLLAPALQEQLGEPARADGDAAFASLLEAMKGADAEAFHAARTAATDVVQSFRAAPLSEADQARRAGQLLRYLSLIPVEYGRGVKQGEVILDLEVLEAQAFLEGAHAAFADLRLPLRARDADETASVEASLTRLGEALTAAAAGTAVADPATIATDAQDATRRLNELFPRTWLEASGDSDFDIVNSLLDQVVAAAAAGQYQQAESSRIEAYAIFETGPEKRLLAFTPDEALKVERLFWEGDGQTVGLYRLLSDRAGLPEVRASRQVLGAELTRAQAALSAGTAPVAVIFNAATIVFREGLEAILILASLLASMIGANRMYKKPLALGAVAALVVTVILFILARTALLSFGRYSEQIEAIVSLLAIGVLLLVMNWFFHKVYWTKWIAKHHEHRRELLVGGAAGQMLGFVLLGFTSVFREGAETVLFLQALVLDAGTWIVVQGVLLGFAATAVVGVLTLVLQTKLPHKKMLIVTGMMIALVLVTMVGSTVHTLQLIGWAPITPIPGAEALPYWMGVWLGIHGTWQGIIAQLVAVAFVCGSYFLAEWQHDRKRSPRTMVGATTNRSETHAPAR